MAFQSNHRSDHSVNEDHAESQDRQRVGDGQSRSHAYVVMRLLDQILTDHDRGGGERL